MTRPRRSRPQNKKRRARARGGSTSAASPGRRSWPPVALAALLILCGAAAYWSSLQGVYLFDDQTQLSETNPHQRSLWPITEAMKAPAGSPAEGRPVLALSFAVSHALVGLEPRGNHLFNGVIHLCCGLALMGLVRRLLGSPRLRPALGDHAVVLGFAVALLWLLHPLNTRAVTYVVQRAESLMGLFYLVTLYCAVRAMGATARRRWYVGAVAACLLGMGTKEVMATAPLLALLADRVFFADSWRGLLSRRWGLHAALAATWLLLAVTLSSVSLGEGSSFTPWVVGPLEYAQTQAWAVTRYLRLSLLPVGLVFDYGSPEVGRLLTGVQLVTGAVVLGITLTGAALAMFKRPGVGFLAAWFFLILAPTSSVMPMDAEFAAEHRMYLPLAAVVALLVLGAHALVERLGARARRPALAALALVAGTLLVMTHLRNRDYHDQLSIWGSSIEAWPINPRAHVNRGNAHARARRLIKAIEDYDRAIELMPDHASAHLSRAMVQEARGLRDEAIASYSRTVTVERRRRAAGRGMRAHNRNVEVLALNGWAWILATSPHARQRDGARAVTLARRAVSLSDRESAAVLDTLAAAHAEAGQFAEAVKVGQRAVKLARSGRDPSLAEYRQRLVSYLARRPHREGVSSTNAPADAL